MKRERMKAQYYMRARIVAQFTTIVALVGGVAWMDKQGKGKSPLESGA